MSAGERYPREGWDRLWRVIRIVEQCPIVQAEFLDGLLWTEECALYRPKVDTIEFDLRADMSDPFIPLASIPSQCTVLGVCQEGVDQLLASLPSLRTKALWRNLAMCRHACHS